MCAQWAELHPVSQELNMQLKTEHLLHLLEQEQTDEAFQVQDANKPNRKFFRTTTSVVCGIFKEARLTVAFVFRTLSSVPP